MSISRMLQLMRNDLVMQSKTIAMTTLAMVFVFLLFNNSYSLVLHIVGLTMTAYAFSDVSDKNRGYRYLLLPASNAEKFFSRWCLTSIVYLLAVNVLVFAMQGLKPLDHIVWYNSLSYLVIQPAFLLGALYFKNRVLLKTSLVFTSIMVAIFSLSMLGLYLFSPLYMPLLATNPEALNGVVDFSVGIASGVEHFFWALFGPICLAIAYVRFKECEN